MALLELNLNRLAYSAVVMVTLSRPAVTVSVTARQPFRTAGGPAGPASPGPSAGATGPGPVTQARTPGPPAAKAENSADLVT